MSASERSRRLLLFPYTVLLSLAFLAGCSLHQSGDGQTSISEEVRGATEADLQVPLYAEAHYFFLLGELALDDEKFEDALGYFQQAAEIEQGSAPFLRRRLAQLYVRAGKLDEALVQLDKTIENNSGDIEALRLRAGILAAASRIDEAAAAYQKLIKLEPKQQDTYIILSSLYAQNKDSIAAIGVLKALIAEIPDSLFGHYYLARLLEASGQTKEATKYYDKALSIDPGSDALQLDLAGALATQGRRDQALIITKRILKNNPRNVTARQLQGQLLWEGKKLDEAISTLEGLRVLEDDPEETRLKIALIRIEKKDFVGAEEELNLILAKQPKNTAARYFLASTFVGMARFNDAVAELLKIEKGERMHVESRTLAAYLLRQEKRFDEAVDAIQDALEVKSDDTGLMVYLATAQREGGHTNAALETMQKVLEKEPNNDNHLFTVGVLYHDAGDETKSEEKMREVIALNPKNANALNFLGYTLAESNRSLPEAEELVKQALAIDGANGYFLDSLGWIYFKMGKYTDALAQLERAVKYAPDDAVILEHLGEVQLALGKREKALKTFEHALRFASQSDDSEVGDRLERRISELKSAFRESRTQ